MDCYNLQEKTFTQENIQEFQRLCNSPQDCLKYMSEVLDLKEYSTRAQHAFVLDYFHGLNLFSAEINLGLEQATMILNFGKDLLCTLLVGKGFQEAEDFFEKGILSLNTKQLDAALGPTFSLIDVRKIIDFFLFIFFQHYALYAYCFSTGACKESRREVVLVETALIAPLSDASSQEELEAQERVTKEALEAEEKARQVELERIEAEKVAAAEALKLEESKKKPESLDQAIDSIVREKLESFKQSFFEGCATEQKRLIEKLAQLEASVTASSPSESKTRKSLSDRLQS
ncbi:hypothetical protein GOP47_0019331 [Adiantum capillus-veneris]|uniref:Uncharacterized protein n=1 Tax=Adiantum capillus-veneris TaxID=13818 RepID=A0A9D4UFE6_ADICA|nr:hypothetical protein GOP47_0019331 [Adiantum capillus-veneris]